jgi:D-lactate dehydrogenase (cytochrome)
MTAARIQDGYGDYLHDESRLSGEAEAIYFPESEAEIRALLAGAPAEGAPSADEPVTVQGARTGLAAGAVPRGGHVLNLSRMGRILGLRREERPGGFLVTVQPGLPLAGLREALQTRSFDTRGWSEASRRALAELESGGPQFFPPDPTETSASLGGMTACNASGACSYFYGPTRRHIQALRCVLADGSLLCLERGAQRARGRSFTLQRDGGAPLSGRLPAYTLPRVKNAAGYFAADDMDLIDLFIGSEGTLGVISEITCRLLPAPDVVLALTAFFPAEAEALAFVRALRRESATADSAAPRALEFFDGHALRLLEGRAREDSFVSLPTLPAGSGAAVYVEYHVRGAGAGGVEQSERALEACAEALEKCGGDIDKTWIADSRQDLQHLKDLRHAVPEAVNLLIDRRRRSCPQLTKLGTDMAVPDDRLEWVVDLYRRDLEAAGLEHVMFGHVGNNHIHVNILPRDMADYEAGRRLYERWAREVVRVGGSVSAEHGIGKLKLALLAEMFGSRGIAEMRELRRLFDPAFRLGRGNLFAPGASAGSPSR